MKEGDLYTGEELPRGWIIKTDGNSNEIVVRDYDIEGYKRKVRRKITNITPKKKKRK
ncbi:hypothetical protein M0Q50_07900 [bacterium]|jgi:hypothetical protein|nr:hypothetical protein [bacterium]